MNQTTHKIYLHQIQSESEDEAVWRQHLNRQLLGQGSRTSGRSREGKQGKSGSSAGSRSVYWKLPGVQEDEAWTKASPGWCLKSFQRMPPAGNAKNPLMSLELCYFCCPTRISIKCWCPTHPPTINQRTGLPSVSSFEFWKKMLSCRFSGKAAWAWHAVAVMSGFPQNADMTATHSLTLYI